MARKKTVITEEKKSSEKNKTKKLYSYKTTIKCKNTHQKDFLKLLKNPNNEICFGVGSAGSGKSYISLAYALSALNDINTPYNKIIIVVPTCEAGNMSIGYLKGTIEDKIGPYIEADTYTMSKILEHSGNDNSNKIIEDLINNEVIDFKIVNFTRGMTFDNSIIMLNESENYSKEEMLLLLTRIGENCKMIITGDPKQLDRKDILKSKKECGIIYAMKKLSHIDKIDSIEFNDNDIVRNPLIQEILNSWD